MKKINLTNFLRKDIINLEEYIPGESVIDLSERFGVTVEKLVKLNANENPYGPSPSAKKAIQKVFLNYYPSSDNKKLRYTIARYCDVDAKQVIVGSGSDELIDLLLRLIISKGDKIITCPPTFSMYKIFTKLNNGTVVFVPRNKNYSIDIENIIRKINKDVKVIFVCNPNNPTGTITPNNQIEELLKTRKLVVIDEAYYEFAKQSALELINKYPNLIVLRTFSKWAGLAGLRVGYALADMFLVNQMMKIKSPFNVNNAAEAATIATLEDLTFAKKSIAAIISERNKMYKSLSKFTNLIVCSSYGNFLYVKVKKEDYQNIKNAFEKNKIALRYYQSALLDNGMRITIGKPSQNKKVIKVFKEYFYE